jgi:hypothetical protein
MGSKMRRTLDIEKIATALKRAAYKAIHGTREERAGRFLPAKKRRVSLAGGAAKQRDLGRRKA